MLWKSCCIVNCFITLWYLYRVIEYTILYSNILLSWLYTNIQSWLLSIQILAHSNKLEAHPTLYCSSGFSYTVKSRFFRKIILLISSFTIFTSLSCIITKAEITSFLNKCSTEKLLLLTVMFVNVKNHGQPWNRLCLTLKQCIDYTIFLLSLCDELNMVTCPHDDLNMTCSDYYFFSVNHF